MILDVRGPTRVKGVWTSSQDIRETAVKAGLRGFHSPIEVARLGELQSHGPFTVFALGDAAFAILGDELLESWLRPESRLKPAGRLADGERGHNADVSEIQPDCPLHGW